MPFPAFVAWPGELHPGAGHLPDHHAEIGVGGGVVVQNYVGAASGRLHVDADAFAAARAVWAPGAGVALGGEAGVYQGKLRGRGGLRWNAVDEKGLRLGPYADAWTYGWWTTPAPYGEDGGSLGLVADVGGEKVRVDLTLPVVVLAPGLQTDAGRGFDLRVQPPPGSLLTTELGLTTSLGDGDTLRLGMFGTSPTVRYRHSGDKWWIDADVLIVPEYKLSETVGVHAGLRL